MSEIPERIREEARKLLDSLGSCNCRECTETAAQALLAAEKRGREEERERATQIVLDWQKQITRGERIDWHAERIAAAIRSTN